MHFFSLDSQPLDGAGGYQHAFPFRLVSNKGRLWCSSSPSKSIKTKEAVNGSLFTACQKFSFVIEYLATFLSTNIWEIRSPRVCVELLLERKRRDGGCH